MNEGFFSTTELRPFVKRKALPPRLNLEFPPTEAAKPKTKHVFDSKPPQVILDIECYINYFLVKFLRLHDDRLIEFEQVPGSPLDVEGVFNIVKAYEVLTFNGNHYDIPMLRLALLGANNRELKNASDSLIKTEMRSWQFEKKHDLPNFTIKHIDLKEIPKGNKISLKLFGGRLHCEKMQELPYSEGTVLTEPQMDEISYYNDNDLFITRTLLLDLLPQIELRRVMSKKYKVDLLSKSDAQIAEAVFREEYFNITKTELSKPEIRKQTFYYQIPKFIHFNNERLNEVLDIFTDEPFIAHGDVIVMPEGLEGTTVKIGYSTYKIGVGGLHSQEKRAFHVTDNNYMLRDWDVSSFYPKVILNCGLYPKLLGKVFPLIYSSLVDNRLAAKARLKEIKKELKTNKTKQLEAELEKYTSDTESLKVVINGSFGKLGSAYSVLYAPDLMVQVTVTGQLSILMLIEMMESKGIPVVSGNTDGIVTKCPRNKEKMMYHIIKRWESITGFTMEETKYAGIFSRDINNYIAIKEDGEVKLKGIFKPADIDKNPENEICSIAMIEYIKFGTPFETTIRNCKDITKFITVRQVNGGAEKNGKYLGKAVRFYHARNDNSAIIYCTNGNKVPLTDGAKPIMDITIPFPDDLDYDWYIDKCSDLF